VPVRRVGKLTLDRNPTNFFAETEQVAFCTRATSSPASTSRTTR
jgi:catalase